MKKENRIGALILTGGMLIWIVLVLMDCHGNSDIEGTPRAPVEINGIEGAILSYESVNGKLPIPSTDRDEQTNGAVMRLLGVGPGNYGKVFLTPRPDQIALGTYLDPWEHEYHIAFDVRNKGTITVGSNEIRSKVAVWSDGPNRKNEYGGGDDIANWKLKTTMNSK